MGKNNSIGSLFIDIQARTAKLEQDLGKVKAILNNTTKEVASTSKGMEAFANLSSNKLFSLTTAVLGAQSAIRILGREIRDVFEHAEKIRGINPEALANIQLMRSNISEMRLNVDKLIANGISKFANFGTALGTGLAMGQNQQEGLETAMPDSTSNRSTLDQQAREQDADYDQKVVAVQLEIARARDMARIAAMTQANQIVELTALSERYTVAAKAQSISTMDASAKELIAFNLSQDAATKLASLKKQVVEAETSVRMSMEKSNVVTLSNTERIRVLNDKLFNLRNTYATMLDLENKANAAGKEDPLALEQQLKVLKEIAALQAQLNTALAKQGQLFRDIGSSLANNLENAIIKGGKLRDILQGIGQDILQILVRKQVTEPLADYIGGSTGLLASLFGGHAMGGPLDGATMVGEKGPELLVPSSGGQSIIPNDKLSGGGRGGSVFNIDARGADQTGMANLLSYIRSVDGSVEKRAVAAVNNQNRRRPQG